MKNSVCGSLLGLLLCFGVSCLSVSAQEQKVVEAKDLKLAEKLLGYWVADEAALFEDLLEKRAKAIESGNTTREKVANDSKLYSRLMVQHYAEGGGSTMYTINGENAFEYKVIAAREELNELDVDVISKKYGTEKGKMEFNGELMTLQGREASGMPKVVLRKLTEKEAKARIERIHKISMSPDNEKAVAEFEKELFPNVNQQPWDNLEMSIEELKKKHKGKNVMVFFHADWCATCQLVKSTVKSHKLLTTLQKHEVVLVFADCSEDKSIGEQELKKLSDKNIIPHAILINKAGVVTDLNASHLIKRAPLLKLIESKLAAKKK